MSVRGIGRRLLTVLLGALLGVILLSLILGLLVDSRLYALIALAPATWLMALGASWLHYRYRSRLGEWERAQREAQAYDEKQARDMLRERRVQRAQRD